MDTATERTDDLYLIVTILKTGNSYTIRRRKPRSLKLNEFCYCFRITINKEEWLGRMRTLDMPKVKPPEIPNPEEIESLMTTTDGSRVMDRLAGRTIVTEVTQYHGKPKQT